MEMTKTQESDDEEELNPLSILLPEETTSEEVEKGSFDTDLVLQFLLQSVNSKLVINQLPSQGLSFQLWPAASTLVTLFDNYKLSPNNSPLFPILSPLLSRPLRLLELGSGTGLAGIAAGAILGARVTLTDLPHVVSNLQFNAEANAGAVGAGGGSVISHCLRWGEIEDLNRLGFEFDIVVASDVVYHSHLFVPLLLTMSWILGGRNGVGILMAHLRRWKKDSVFFNKARKLFHVRIIHQDPPLPGSRTGVAVYSFTRKDDHHHKSLRASCIP